MNLNKIGILFTAIDPDVLISDFAKVKEDNGNYYGTKGSIRLENNQIHLYYKRTNDEIKFSANMFLNYGNNFAVSSQDKDGLSYATRVQDYKDGYPYYDDKGYPYYNSNAIGKYFVNPSLFVFDGSNSMTLHSQVIRLTQPMEVEEIIREQHLMMHIIRMEVMENFIRLML